MLWNVRSLFLCCAAVVWALRQCFGCPAACTCLWKGGKETVECINRGLFTIPAGIDSSTQVLHLTNNSLHSLRNEVFLSANLLNLQKIYLSNCRLSWIHNSAFSRLTNLVELDLSTNLLISVPSDTFKDYPDLRRLILSNNPIQKIDGYKFANLSALINLDLSRCQIDYLDINAFYGLQNLLQLKLDGNRLTAIDGLVLAPLITLHEIELQNNPWKCDCHLRDLRVWLKKNKIHQNSPLECSQPPELQGQRLDEAPEENLACEPKGLYNHRRIEAYEGNDAVLVCKVSATPEPRIRWVWQGRTINNFTYLFPSSQLFVIREYGAVNKTSILKILSVSDKNSGQYACVAKNAAGEFTMTSTLHVLPTPLQEPELHLGQIIGIFIGVMTLTMLLVILCVLIFKRKHIKEKYLKNLSIYNMRKPLNSPYQSDFGRNSEGRSAKNSSAAVQNAKRPCSPDAMTFLVNDFGVPRSPYLNRLDITKPDVVHVDVEPARQGSKNESNNSATTNNDDKCNDKNLLEAQNQNQTVQNDEDKQENNVKDNNKDECEVTDDQNSIGDFEESKESKMNLDLDLDLEKLKWKETFPVCGPEFEEEIEMKVHFDHMSAESKWKQSNLSLSKFTTACANEWPGALVKHPSADFVTSNDWFPCCDDVPESFKACKGYDAASAKSGGCCYDPTGAKFSPQEGWWPMHELADDSNYGIYTYNKPSPTSYTTVGDPGKLDPGVGGGDGCGGNPVGDPVTVSKSHSSNFGSVSPTTTTTAVGSFPRQSVSPMAYPPFAGFLYDSRETDL